MDATLDGLVARAQAAANWYLKTGNQSLGEAVLQAKQLAANASRRRSRRLFENDIARANAMLDHGLDIAMLQEGRAH